MSMHNFVYQFKLIQHHDYAAHKPFCDSVREFTFIGLHPEEKWNGETNPTVDHIEPSYLYCDAGSPLWQKFVEAGLLTGDDALPTVEMAIQDMAKEVIVEAIRDIVQETGAFDLDPGHGFLQQPPPEALEEYPYLSWWFQPGK